MIQGDIHPDFWAVARALEQQVRRSGGGAAVCVYHRGVPVVDIWAGVQDERGTPWHHETTALSFSTTKGVTSTALHVLADRGLVDYDAPVAEYWPEFGAQGKGGITVRHLLCHEAGMYRLQGRIGQGRAEERGGERLQPQLPCRRGARAALGAVGQVEVFQGLLGFRGGDARL